MATKVHMEALSPTMEEGQVVKWIKAEGDPVENGEVIAEIETDKATMELVARGAGVLRKILLDEGGTASVGEVIAVIGDEDEDIGELVDGGGAAEADEGEEEEGEADGEEEEAAEEEEAEGEEEPAEEEGEEEEEEADGDEAAEDEDEADEEEKKTEKENEEPRAGDGERVRASPLARRLAQEAGVELSSIEGSGPQGRVVKKDVERAKEEGAGRPAAAGAPEDEYEDVPLSQMRKTIAKRLVESLGPIPHFFLNIDVDMGRALAARERINQMLAERSGDEKPRKVSVNDVILKATAQALRKHPEVNAHWKGDAVRRFNAVHVGVAVAVEDGLITPVIRNAHLKGVDEIGQEVRELAGRAREKKLKPDEYQGATFSVSNLGMMGIHEFTAVINPPEAGIIAVGAVEEVPVVEDGEVVVRPRMKITMSCDHRVVDGAMGARFLQTLKAMLEEPGVMVA